ncbi:hypothetical protein DP939_31245 [Spongiactinospora rosea]|uniref:Peptidase S1 domain-containing protein n=1 Tax=Spongiactinospora rosea TaxID=2248750 RepID=A0A366LSD0_9ACTN|nr:hypothetical protein DP939_31245 [Spongiactinospora rosea]
MARAESPAAAAGGVSNAEPTSGRIDDFWTAERIAAAPPADAPGPGAADRDAQDQVENTLAPVSAPGTPPTERQATPEAAPDTTDTAPEAEPNAPESAPDTDASPALAGPRAERWHRQGSMPATSIGKLYFVRPDGATGYCSGSVIASANRNTVWTAGHCIHQGGGGTANYFHDVIFIPDADNGLEPHGRWVWRYMTTTNGWANSGNFSYDLAAVAFSPQAARGNLSDYVGSQGYKFGFGQEFQNVHAFGYPQDGYQRTDFTGNDLWYCVGNTHRVSDTDDRMRIECDMFHGSSGGPWLEDLQLSRGWGYIIGINSHRYVDGNGNPIDIYMYSPNHGDAAINVHNAVSNA